MRGGPQLTPEIAAGGPGMQRRCAPCYNNERAEGGPGPSRDEIRRPMYGTPALRQRGCGSATPARVQSCPSGGGPPSCLNMGQVLIQGAKVRKHGVAVLGQARVTVRHVPRNTCCSHPSFMTTKGGPTGQKGRDRGGGPRSG